jgi:hypothetical protein
MKQITLVPKVQKKEDIVDNVARWQKLGYTHCFLTLPEIGLEGVLLLQKFVGFDYEKIKRNIVY